MKRRHFMLLAGGASSGALSVGSGAFSSVEAERGVAVNVVEDEEAYLGLEQVAEVVPANEDLGTIRVKNRFATDLDLDVTITGRDSDAVNTDEIIEHGDFTIGEERDIYIDSTGHVTSKLQFAGEAGGASVNKTLDLDVIGVCVDFRSNGGGNSDNGGGNSDNGDGNGDNGDGNGDNGGGAVHIHGEFSELDLKANGSDAGSISSESGGKYVLTPDSGQINTVTIDGIVYERNGDVHLQADDN